MFSVVMNGMHNTQQQHRRTHWLLWATSSFRTCECIRVPVVKDVKVQHWEAHVLLYVLCLVVFDGEVRWLPPLPSSLILSGFLLLAHFWIFDAMWMGQQSHFTRFKFATKKVWTLHSMKSIRSLVRLLSCSLGRSVSRLRMKKHRCCWPHDHRNCKCNFNLCHFQFKSHKPLCEMGENANFERKCEKFGVKWWQST